jgi:molybdate transport system substrate-binding protein
LTGRVRYLIICLCLLLIPTGCSNGESSGKVELMVSAAASLTDALQEMKAPFEAEHPNIALTFNFGSSGKLAQQVEQGAPSDVFISASEKDMDTLQDEGLIVDGTRVDFTANELVLITNKDKTLAVDSFKDIDSSTIGHFAIGAPESVPVGRYTKEVLDHLGLWEPLQNKMVLGSDVRQVLTHVEMGNADLGVVYSSDAKISDQVKVLAVADAEWHGPIVYPGAVVSETKKPEEAKAFLAFLTSDEGKEVLKKYGFK